LYAFLTSPPLILIIFWEEDKLDSSPKCLI
jgi:hypothetical protein